MNQRDSNLDHAAVKQYRETCRLTANWIQRRDIVTTVKWAISLGIKEETALEAWKAICEQFMREGNPPKRVDWIMDRFEQHIRKIV